MHLSIVNCQFFYFRPADDGQLLRCQNIAIKMRELSSKMDFVTFSILHMLTCSLNALFAPNIPMLWYENKENAYNMWKKFMINEVAFRTHFIQMN